MRFVYAHGEGFVVVRVTPNEDGSVMVLVGSNVERERDEEIPEESVELLVRVRGAKQMSLAQIEAAALARVQTVLDGAQQALDKQVTDSPKPA